MKTILVSLSILLCAIALPALGALTDADLDKIRLIVNEAEKRIKDEIVTLKTDGAVIKTEVANLKETVSNDFDNIQKNFDRQNNIIIACIGIPLGIITILFAWRALRDRANDKQIHAIITENENLKKQQTINP